MSRSRKKVYGFVDRNPFMKKYFNRVIRRVKVSEHLSSGCEFKKRNETYDICDYRMITFKKAVFMADLEYYWENYDHDNEAYKDFDDYVKKEIIRNTRK